MMTDSPDFGQIDATIGGCANPGWKHDVDGDRLKFRHRLWPDWMPTNAQVKVDDGEWIDITLARGDRTSDTDVCKATRVTFDVPLTGKVALRTFMPDGTIGETRWFRRLLR